MLIVCVSFICHNVSTTGVIRVEIIDMFQLCTLLWLAGWTDSANLEHNHAVNDSVAKEQTSQMFSLIIYAFLGAAQCKFVHNNLTLKL